MLIADGDAMVRGKVGSFLWAPQAEIEVMINDFFYYYYFFFYCIAELAIKPCRSSRSNCAENSGFQTLAKQETKTPQSNKTPPNPKHNTTQKPASVWNVKREVRRG